LTTTFGGVTLLALALSDRALFEAPGGGGSSESHSEPHVAAPPQAAIRLNARRITFALHNKEKAMRTALKLLLLAATTLVALALSATSAPATITVEDEPSDDLCPLLNQGGCHVEFESEEDVPMFFHLPGVGELPQSNCEILFEARIGPDGQGHIVDAALLPPHNPNVANCTREPCTTGPSMDQWLLQLTEPGPGSEDIVITLCTSPNGDMSSKTECTLALPLAQTGHMQSFAATSASRCAQTPNVAISGVFLSHEDGFGSEEIVIHHPAG
jgi:hypothetical protein